MQKSRGVNKGVNKKGGLSDSVPTQEPPVIEPIIEDDGLPASPVEGEDKEISDTDAQRMVDNVKKNSKSLRKKQAKLEKTAKKIQKECSSITPTEIFKDCYANIALEQGLISNKDYRMLSRYCDKMGDNFNSDKALEKLDEIIASHRNETIGRKQRQYLKELINRGVIDKEYYNTQMTMEEYTNLVSNTVPQSCLDKIPQEVIKEYISDEAQSEGNISAMEYDINKFNDDDYLTLYTASRRSKAIQDTQELNQQLSEYIDIVENGSYA